MRKTVAALLLVVGTGCVERVQVIRYVPGIEVPAESNQCKRECMVMAQAGCREGEVSVASDADRNGAGQIRQVLLVQYGPFAEKFGCPDIYSDCLMTCPEAKIVGDGPRMETVSDSMGFLKGQGAQQ